MRVVGYKEGTTNLLGGVAGAILGGSVGGEFGALVGAGILGSGGLEKTEDLVPVPSRISFCGRCFANLTPELRSAIEAPIAGNREVFTPFFSRKIRLKTLTLDFANLDYATNFRSVNFTFLCAT